MSDRYIVEPIGPRTNDRAYLPVRACGFALTLSEWRAQANGARAFVARNAQGYVKGLCIYSIRNDSRYGRLLDVPIFAVASAADPQIVTAVLVAALRSECERSRCPGIRSWPMTPDAWTRRQSPEAVGTGHRLFLRPLASVAEIAAE
jgi:hypothetical protein